jgi:uncharacterized protein (TIGR02757 family)
LFFLSTFETMEFKSKEKLGIHLNKLVERFNHIDFIQNDPIQIPHGFIKKQDIEISAFWTSILSWGQRSTIINKSEELFELMDNSPHDFILHHTEKDRLQFSGWKHRTFQYPDTFYFLEWLQWFYGKEDSLEEAFILGLGKDDETIENGITRFRSLFFELETAPQRTRKHVSSPSMNTTCKRINMFLRWMVRKDKNGVDFGLWGKIKPNQLLIPLDVHVERVARELGLLQRKQVDWAAVIELTENLREFDKKDPIKYDFALFGLGVLDRKKYLAKNLD